MLEPANIRKLVLRALFVSAVASAVVFWAFPLVWVAICSFKKDKLIISQEIVWLFVPTLEHYARVLTTHNFARFFGNSLVVATGTTAVVLATSFPAAYGLSRYRTGGKALTVGILVTRIAPPAAMLMPFFILFKLTGLLNSLWALILVNIALNLSFALLLLKSFIDEIPVELEAAARVEGANLSQILCMIVFPLARSGVITTSVFTFIFTWNEYLYAMVFCSSNRVKTLPVAAGDFITAYAIEWGPVFAAGMLILAPVLVLTYILQKYIVRGLTTGAVK